MRLGHPGPQTMTETQNHSTGTPTDWKQHPFQFCDDCTDSKIHKTPSNKTEIKPSKFGARFPIDYGFMPVFNDTFDAYPKQNNA